MNSHSPNRGWVFYDGECGLCTAWANRFAKNLNGQGFDLARLQETWVVDRLTLNPEEPLMEMALLTKDGKVLWGADAIVHLSQIIWWARPIYWFSKFSIGKFVIGKVYRWIAVRRHCLSGACRVK